MKAHGLFLTLSLMSIGSAFGAVSLNVNTTNDEFGENLANCSLREAIESVNTHSAFGGCVAGQRFGTNTIKLEAKEYVLTRGELIIAAEMSIVGIGNNFDEKDTITKTKPKRHSPTTLINAQSKNRIFNSATHKPTLTLGNVKLINGHSDTQGGAILAGGSVLTTNVAFENNRAEQQGGAIYLLGKTATLSANSSLWQNNQVTHGVGAVLAMSCLDELKPTARTLDIIQSSIVLNGDTNTNSIIEACGTLTFNLKTTTVGENTANSAGAIIRFNDNTSVFTGVNIETSTLVQNKVAPVIDFNKAARINSNHSVIAFNEAQGCIGTDNSQVFYIGTFNLLQNCSYVALTNLDNSTQSDVVLPTPLPVTFANEFNPLGNYGGTTPTYLPQITSQYVLNKGSSCSNRIDQRGSVYSNDTSIVCDLGAVERRIAVAVVDKTAVLTNNKTNNRTVEINVLENDIPSETDLTDDNIDARGNIAKDADGKYLLELTDTHNDQCSVVHRTEENLLPIILFDNGGKILSDTQNVTCKYTFTDSNGNKAAAGELLFKVQNKIPSANDDTFTLASESDRLVMDVANNDNDDGDGVFGGLCTQNSVKCNGGYYIRVVSSPSLGIIEGDRRECPDFDETNKFLCYRGDLIYRPNNTLSPFDDSFTYVVYDTDLEFSAPATVTIRNQSAPNGINSTSAGSLEWFSLLALTSLALYRRRKYYFA